jgi:low affinity Fe/Cu permease
MTERAGGENGKLKARAQRQAVEAKAAASESRARNRMREVAVAAPEPVARASDWFGAFAAQASAWVGSRWAFALAGLVIVVWAVSGPYFHYSDTWQLVINTGTTIVTFLMVFLIQNTQNRDARAINLKLNELIRAIDAARDQMIDIESLSDVELKVIQEKFEKIKAAVGDLPVEGE